MCFMTRETLSEWLSVTYRLTEYNFNFRCKQKINTTFLLGYLFIQSFFTLFGLRSGWSYVILLQMNRWRRENDRKSFFSRLFFLRAASFNYYRFLLWIYICSIRGLRSNRYRMQKNLHTLSSLRESFSNIFSKSKQW